MVRFLLEFFGICAGGAVLGLVLNAASARPAALTRAVYPAAASGNSVCGASPEAQHEKHGHRSISQAEAVAACNGCSMGFVDARGAAAFAEGHVIGALHLPPAGHADEPAVLQKLRQFPTVVVYDSGGGCGLAEGVADRLSAAGFPDVRLLEGSWQGWMSAGGPAQSGACQACAHHEATGDHR